jgi:hypothetical protein
MSLQSVNELESFLRGCARKDDDEFIASIP